MTAHPIVSERPAADSSPIVPAGFSCREQVAQPTDRRALHLAEVLQLALRGRDAWPRGERPETASARCVPPELAWTDDREPAHRASHAAPAAEDLHA